MDTTGFIGEACSAHSWAVRPKGPKARHLCPAPLPRHFCCGNDAGGRPRRNQPIHLFHDKSIRRPKNMPLLDLPLDALLRYAGRNPRPADFDAYWDTRTCGDAMRLGTGCRARAELMPFEGRLRRVLRSLTFTGIGGARVSTPNTCARSIRHVAPHPAIVLMFHGYSAPQRRLERQAQLRSRAASRWPRWTAAGRAESSEDVGGVQGNTLQRPHHPRPGRPQPGEALLPLGMSTSTRRSSRGSSWRCPRSTPQSRRRHAAARRAARLTLACAALDAER